MSFAYFIQTLFTTSLQQLSGYTGALLLEHFFAADVGITTYFKCFVEFSDSIQNKTIKNKLF